MSERWLFAMLIALLAFLVFARPFSAGPLRRILFGSSGESATALQAMQLKNDALRAEIAKLSEIQKMFPEDVSEYLPALVYSRYPFSFKDTVLVGAGVEHGVEEGGAAVVSISGEKVFVGRVERVFKRTSSVQTVFDSRLKLSVRVGDEGIDALLTGGSEPMLTLISKDKTVHMDAIVYSAGEGFPLGIAVGRIGEIRFSEDRLFQEARLMVSYDLNRTHFVLLQKGKPRDAAR